jgi:hypothetical protein
VTNVYGRKKINKISKEQFEEIMGYLDFLNTGIWVSILPDEIIDLNPSDEEVVETATFVCDMIKAVTGCLKEIHIKPPRTIGDVRFNFAAWAHYMLERALKADSSVRVKLIIDRAGEIERMLSLIGSTRD